MEISRIFPQIILYIFDIFYIIYLFYIFSRIVEYMNEIEVKKGKILLIQSLEIGEFREFREFFQIILYIFKNTNYTIVECMNEIEMKGRREKSY